MRLLILSDLHLEFAPILSMRVSCDVVVLAGDTNLRLTGIRWAMDTFPDVPVLYVFGNHEFYGEKWPRLIEKGRALAAGSNVHILENDTVEIGGWRFFGATLWSDFQAIGDDNNPVTPRSQSALGSRVATAVGVDLCGPELSLCSWRLGTTRATVPKTAVNEDANALFRKCEVWRSGKF